MKLIGIMPVRNEAWVIGLSLRAAMLWVDEMIVLDHCSTDGTSSLLRQIAAEYPGRIMLLVETDPVFHEMAYRQKLLEAARERGATHIALIDADEILTGDLLPVIRDRVEATAPGTCVMIPMRCLWRGLNSYRTDQGSHWGRMWASTWFADSPELHWKDRNGYDFHHRHPMGAKLTTEFQEAGGMLHLQFVSWRRLLAKQALYKMTEIIRWPNTTLDTINQRYNPAVDETGIEKTLVPLDWWRPYARLMPQLKTAADPWQEEECRRLMAEHGAEKFAGLDLFGVVGQCVTA